MYKVEREFHGKTLTIETGEVAKQTNGAVLVKCGGSVVMVTFCMGQKRDFDFLPLTIDYIEKTYASGKIPGGFFKREGRLSDRETLNSRLIDRPCRPLFPKNLGHELQIAATVLSSDEEVPTDVLAMCGASAAVSISDVPFDGPLAGVRVCRKDGKLVYNPSMEVAEKSDLHFIIAGTESAILMVEGGAKVVPEDEVLEAIFGAHKEMQTIIEMQKELVEQCGKAKITVDPEPAKDADLVAKVTEFSKDKLLAALTVKDKLERKVALSAFKKECVEALVEAGSENADSVTSDIKSIIEDLVYNEVRSLAFDKKVRIDGRDFSKVRQIDIKPTFLPKTHGSVLFTRGETQAIVTATLAVGDTYAQRVDTLHKDEFKRFMLHYNFPAYSVGEARPMRGPGRREIGHGTLAERALLAVVPEGKDNPYVIRIVSEITESNGSSSMASVCGGSLAMMDAGVKIKAPVAGIAMGLLKSETGHVVLSDILGDEDHLGDMDFKVCGTEEGITALQMDIKIKGLSQEIMREAMGQAREGRLHILNEMNKALSESRSDVSENAPSIEVIKINPNRIRDLIGSGGKTIKSITEAHAIDINIEDDGTVTVSGSNKKELSSGMKVIKALTEEAEIGKIYTGLIKKIESFGAFVEIIPGIQGLLHISELEDGHVKNVEDVVKEGEQVNVKVLDADSNGRIKLSRKAAMAELGA